MTSWIGCSGSRVPGRCLLVGTTMRDVGTNKKNSKVISLFSFGRFFRDCGCFEQTAATYAYETSASSSTLRQPQPYARLPHQRQTVKPSQRSATRRFAHDPLLRQPIATLNYASRLPEKVCFDDGGCWNVGGPVARG